MSKAVIYCRFSPRKNQDKSESNETQEELCRKWCDEQMMEVRSVHEDRAMSGSDPDRPGLWDALEALQRGDVLLVYKLDRLARNTYLHFTLEHEVEKKRCRIVSVTGEGNGASDEDKLVRTILAALAEYQRKVSAARTKAAMLRHQRAGRRMSARTPYGWDRRGKNSAFMVEVPEEQEVIKCIMALHKEGHSLRKIGENLDGLGIKCREGHWWPCMVNGIIRRGLAAEA
jgi:DNA invertase Pin-like site-specific DNA recombinase